MTISNFILNFNVLNKKEENKMTNVSFYLNGVAISSEEAAAYTPAVEMVKKVVKATTARKIASLAGFLAGRYNCSFNAAYAASIQGGCRPAAEQLLSEWAARNWASRRPTAAELAEHKRKLALLEAIKGEILLAKKEAKKRHYDAITSKVVRSATKKAKVRVDRSLAKMEREYRSELAMSQLLTDIGKVNKVKANRVWKSAHALFIRAAAVISRATKKVTRRAVTNIAAVNALFARIDVAKAEDARSSIGAADMSAVNRLSLELALEATQSMFNANNIETGIRAIDWWDDSRFIDEDRASECAERQKEDNMFKFDLQLFANKHINNRKYVNAVKSDEGNAVCYRFTAINTNDGVRFVLDTTSAEITPLTRHYLQSNGVFQNLCCREMIAKRGFSGYAVLDLSNIATSSSERLRRATAFYFTADYYLGKDENGKTVLAYRDTMKNKFFIVSESRSKNGKFREIGRSIIYDENSIIRDNWIRFKSNKIASASKGRKVMADMFAEDSNFEGILNEATFGEYDAVKGMLLDSKGQADKWTRLGSKSTRMGSMNVEVENYIVRLAEDGSTDGSYNIAARKMAEAVAYRLGIETSAKLERECCGYMLQARPYTGKGAGVTKSDKHMKTIANTDKIYVIDKDKITDREKEILAMFTDKELRKANNIKLGDDNTYPVELKGYTAIGVKGNDIYGWDLIGDLNFYKDRWDFDKVSGMNVLSVAHYEKEDGFKNAFTSAQMLKVVLRAVREANCMDLYKKFDRVMKGIIDDNIADRLDFDRSVRSFKGDKKLDLSFPGSDYMMINPTTWRDRVGTHQMVINQMVNSVNEMINRDRYAVPGHSAMITCDCTYDFGGSILTVDNKIVEAYDPVANRYFDENNTPEEKRVGMAIKYPAMGTREFLMFKYVSEDQAIERINNLSISDNQKEVCIEEIKNFKEGGMMIPCDLEVIAWFAAGSDEDGDKVTALFASPNGDDLTSIVIESGMIPRAVKIGTPKECSPVKSILNMEAYALHASKQIAVGNKSVGVVTNTFRMFTEGIYQNLNIEKVFNFYASLFRALGMGTEVKDHSKKYRSMIELEKIDGNIVVNKTTDKITREIFEYIKTVPVTIENIKAVLDDFDVLGRHCQELTIDAQKKFYDVFCDWIDDIAFKYSILPLKFGINIEFVAHKGKKPIGVYFNENAGYKVVNNRISTVDCVVEYNKCSVLRDVFSVYRTYSANKCMEIIEAEVEMYKTTVAMEKDREMKRAIERTSIENSNDIKAIRRMEKISRAYMTIATNYISKEKAIKKEMEEENAVMTIKQSKKLFKEIKKSMNDDFADMINYLSNEIRCIAAEEGLCGDEMVRIFDGAYIPGNIKSRVIKQERFVYDIHNSEMSMWEMKLHQSDMTRFLIEKNIKVLRVINGMAMLLEEGYGADQPVNFIDGKYGIRVNTLANGEKEVFINRPMDEFINVPEADNNLRLINGHVSTKDDADHMDQLLISGSEYTVCYKDKKYTLVDAAGNDVAPLYFGGHSEKDMVGGEYAYKLYGKRYANFRGKLVGKIVNVEPYDNENGKKYFNYIIVLEK